MTPSVRVAVAAAVSFVVAPFVVALLAVALLVPTGAIADVTVPYTDLSAKGSITLCDAAGHRVTAGSIDDKPFVLKAVATVPAPSPYNGAGRTAVLVAYQPSKTSYPDQWNGDTLTATSQYTDARHPMVIGTPLDFTLAQYLKEFPASYDGFVQLRMYFGAKGQGVMNDTYPTTDLRVVGHTWTVVHGGTGDCTAGSAVSNEVAIAHLPGATASPGPRSTATSSASASASASSSDTPAGAGGQASGQTPRASSAPSGPPTWVAGLVALLLLAIAGILVFVRRGQPDGSPGGS